METKNECKWSGRVEHDFLPRHMRGEVESEKEKEKRTREWWQRVIWRMSELITVTGEMFALVQWNARGKFIMRQMKSAKERTREWSEGERENGKKLTRTRDIFCGARVLFFLLAYLCSETPQQTLEEECELSLLLKMYITNFVSMLFMCRFESGIVHILIHEAREREEEERERER